MAIEQHDLVAALKQVQGELGRHPRRDEFCQHSGISRHHIERLFGSWLKFTQAAGSETPVENKFSTKKRIQDFYHRDVKQMLTKPKEPCFPLMGPFRKILCIGDLHCPWWCEDSVSLIYCLIEELKPDVILTMGDDYDFYSFARFPRSHMLFNPQDELTTARKQLETLWKTIRKLAPKAELYSLIGNHNLRPHKQILAKCPELEPFFDIKKWFEFDGVTTVHDAREPLVIDGISNIHGFKTGGGHTEILNTHVSHGHTHRGGYTLKKINGAWLAELDCGYVGNPAAPCFNFTSVKETRWTRGVGWWSQYSGAFLPFE